MCVSVLFSSARLLPFCSLSSVNFFSDSLTHSQKNTAFFLTTIIVFVWNRSACSIKQNDPIEAIDEYNTDILWMMENCHLMYSVFVNVLIWTHNVYLLTLHGCVCICPLTEHPFSQPFGTRSHAAQMSNVSIRGFNVKAHTKSSATESVLWSFLID